MTRFARGKGSKASNEREPEEATSWSEIKEQLAQKEEAGHLAIKHTQADNKRRENYQKFLDEQAESENKAKVNTWADFPNTTQVIKKVNKKVNVGAKKPKPAVVLPKKKYEEMTAEEQKKVTKRKEKILKQLEKKKLKKAQEGEPQVEQDTKTKPGACVTTHPVNKQESSPKSASPQNSKKHLNQTNVNGDIQNVAKKTKKSKKFDPNKQKTENAETVTINGQTVEIVRFDGFPIMKKDAEELKELRKQMISKGLSHSDVNATMKLQRRRAEKSLARLRKNVCYNCRKAGHVLSECPEVDNESNVDTAASGICFKCGSTEHTSFVCKVVQNQEFRFASCFICKQQGHISWQCPDNPRGLYPKGGACKSCGDVTHLKKDCPKYVAEQEEKSLSVDTLQTHTNPDAMDPQIPRPASNGQVRVNKIIKF